MTGIRRVSRRGGGEGLADGTRRYDQSSLPALCGLLPCLREIVVHSDRVYLEDAIIESDYGQLLGRYHGLMVNTLTSAIFKGKQE